MLKRKIGKEKEVLKASTIYCDKCKQGFKHDDVVFKNIALQNVITSSGQKDNIEVQYFLCPYCKEPYIVFVENQLIRERKVDYVRLKESIRKDYETKGKTNPSKEERLAKKKRVLEIKEKSLKNSTKKYVTNYIRNHER